MRPPAPLWRAGFLALWLLAAPAAANAQGLAFATDPTAPVDVTAGVIDWFGDKARVDFSDMARFEQGPMRMQASSMHLALKADGTIDRLTAKGAVTVLSRQADGEELRRAEAQQAVYDPTKNKLVLTGNVRVVDPESVLSGARLDIDMTDGRAQLHGGGAKSGKKGRARIEMR